MWGLYKLLLIASQIVIRWALERLEAENARRADRLLMRSGQTPQEIWDYLYEEAVQDAVPEHVRQSMHRQLSERCLSNGLRPPQYEPQREQA